MVHSNSSPRYSCKYMGAAIVRGLFCTIYFGFDGSIGVSVLQLEEHQASVEK